MTMIDTLMIDLLGTAGATPLESAILYSIKAIMALVIYDTVLEVFRVAARIMRIN